MRKKYRSGIWLGLFLLLSACLPGKTQTFLDSSSVWSIWYDASGGGGGNIGYQIRLSEPVLSNGFWESDMYYARNQNPDEWTHLLPKLREDSTGNIYLNFSLLYDFNLISGDTFQDMRCILVDTVLLDIPRKRWYFKCLDNPSPGFTPVDTWIEGIGSIMRGLFYPGFWGCSMVVGNPYTQLICFHHSGNLVYMNPLLTNCLKSSNWYAPEKWPADDKNYWSYSYEEQTGFGGVNLGNVHIESIKDTVVGGFPCRKYQSTTVNHLNQTLSDIPFFLRQTGTLISYSFGGQFYELFDLGADPGYSWTTRNPYEIYGLTPGPDSMSTFTVDSIYYQTRMGQQWSIWDPVLFRSLAISSSSQWNFHLPVMETTGGRWFFFPGKWDEWINARPTYLRCCNNKNWEPAPFYYLSPCFYLSTGIEEQENNGVLLKTCPDYIEIEHNWTGSDNVTVSLFDVYGRQVYGKTVSLTSRIVIPSSNLPKGIFMVRIAGISGTVFTRKIYVL